MITASTQDFRSAVALAALVTERRNAIPILSTLRCRANGALEISGTDLDATIVVTVPRDPGEDAAFTLGDYQFVAKSVGASGEKVVGFTPDDGKLAIEAGALSINVKSSLPVDDWPTDCGTIAQDDFSATLSSETLRHIARVIPAISTEETRYYLNGIHIHHVDGWNYRAVTTDGHRMIYVDFTLPDAKGVLEPIIIPRKAVKVLMAALSKASEPLRISVGKGVLRNSTDTTAPDRAGVPRVAFSGKKGRAGVLLSSKTIDGTFPAYGRVIPTGNTIRAVVAVADLRRAIEATGNPNTRVRAVEIEFPKGLARLTSIFAATDTEAKIDIAADHNAPANFSIGFNGQYLHDMLSVITGDEIALSFADAASPVLIKDPADTAFTAVLMPMRV